jgi:hypothetical protein
MLSNAYTRPRSFQEVVYNTTAASNSPPRDIVEFPPNLPVSVVLKYSEGRHISNQHGERMMYSLPDGRLMFLHLDAAQTASRDTRTSPRRSTAARGNTGPQHRLAGVRHATKIARPGAGRPGKIYRRRRHPAIDNATHLLYSLTLTSAQFKRWLEKKGCTFESGKGGHLTVRLGVIQHPFYSIYYRLYCCGRKA